MLYLEFSMKFGKIEVDSILSSILPRLFKDRFLPETRSNLLEIDFFLTDLSPPSAGNWTRDRSGQSWADFWKGVIDHREAREMAVVRARGSGTTPGSGEQLRGKKHHGFYTVVGKSRIPPCEYTPLPRLLYIYIHTRSFDFINIFSVNRCWIPLDK